MAVATNHNAQAEACERAAQTMRSCAEDLGNGLYGRDFARWASDLEAHARELREPPGPRIEHRRHLTLINGGGS